MNNSDDGEILAEILGMTDEEIKKEAETLILEKEIADRDETLKPNEEEIKEIIRNCKNNAKENKNANNNLKQGIFRRIYEGYNKVAGIVLIILGALVIASLSTNAMKKKNIKWFNDISDDYSILTHNGETEYEIYSQLGDRWEGKNVPTKIPKEFCVFSDNISESFNEIVFKNEEGGIIAYSETIGNSVSVIDSCQKDGYIEIDINGLDGYYSINENNIQVIWENGDSVFLVCADSKYADFNEILDVCKSVKERPIF